MWDFPELRMGSEELKNWSPRIDISETDNSIVVDVELPGLTKDDFKIRAKDGILRITGDRKIEKEDKSKSYTRIERSYGSFSRSVAIPAGVDTSQVKATFVDGVLKVTIPKPKSEEDRGHEIKIE
eukprot:TRINITY_DN2241_c0_g1_i1.p1 TRINITY_DN2241_c0_g1~~TRINITY_DN2241_c0_g1_i1.p1  ORF type:complete len:125 (-),score=34.36 TRINITY_DN2241_c0_g1_i1:160-534(-)